MVARHGGKALGESIAHHHPNADGVDELLDLGRHIGAGGGEEVGILKAELLAHEAQHGAVQRLILQCKGEWRTLAATEILYVVLLTNGKGVAEEFPTGTRCIINLLLHAHEDLLPEAWHAGHTGGMRLAHGLLDFLRVGVQDELCALGQAEISPTALEDMSQRQEAHHTVFLADRYAFVVGLHGCVVLSVGKDDTL